MDVDHRGAHILVAEQLLNGAYVITTLQQMCGEGMPQSVATCLLGDSCPSPSFPHGALDQRLVQMMAAMFARLAIAYGSSTSFPATEAPTASIRYR